LLAIPDELLIATKEIYESLSLNDVSLEGRKAIGDMLNKVFAEVGQEGLDSVEEVF